MADYIYLMETRLTPAQGRALAAVRDAARSAGMTVFLVGGAVRDLTNGTAIRDLDVAVQGPAQQLRKPLEAAGATVVGESASNHSLHLTFSGGVRLEVGSTLSVTFPKPGRPVAVPATIQEDLRRRDFTANAMAISLNEGSYGLLMDPLNGVADTENRELRLVSNYGFLEDPSRMIRAARLISRLGWQLEEKTQARYEAGKAEGYISAMNAASQGYELEEIFHEEDPLRALSRLEAEGWMAALFPALESKKVNETELARVRDAAGQLESAGIFPDTSAANFAPMTAKLGATDVAELKKKFARPGYVQQIEAMEADGKAFAAEFTGKAAALPSDAWKLLHAAVPEQVLTLAFSSRSAPVQNKLKAFFTEWPSARQRIPYALMAEMRIVPELPGYGDLLESLFFELMNGKLDTLESARAFLEPFSPPAPPPPPNLRRRAAKRETKPKSRAKKASAVKPDFDELPTLAAAATPAAEAPDAPAAVVKASEKSSKASATSRKAAAGKLPAVGSAAETSKSVKATKPSVAKDAPAAAKKKVVAKPAATAAKATSAAAKLPVKSSGKSVVKAAAKKSPAPAKKAPTKQPTSVVKKGSAKASVVPAKKLVAVKAQSKKLAHAAGKLASKKPAAKKSLPAKKIVVKKALSSGATQGRKTAPKKAAGSGRASAPKKAPPAKKAAAAKQPSKAQKTVAKTAAAKKKVATKKVVTQKVASKKVAPGKAPAKKLAARRGR